MEDDVNDRHDDLRHLELVSAYLDGEVSAAERAQVESNPELLAYAETLRSVQTQLRDVGGPSAVDRETTIRAALDAFDPAPAETAALAPASSSPAPTTTTDAPSKRRSTNRPTWNRAGRWLTAAAAAAALGFAVTQIGDRGNDGSTVRSEAASDTGAASDTEAAFSVEAAAPADTAAAAAEAAASTVGEIGGAADVQSSAPIAPAFDAEADLVTYAVSARTTARPADDGAAYKGCSLVDSDAAVIGPIVWRGEPATLILRSDRTGTTTAIAIAADCSVLVSVIVS